MRKAHPKDLAAIARLSHQTLFLGREGPKVFPSETLWGALFVAPYLEAGCCNLVAEEEGRVVGYILGACADRPLALAFAKRLLWALQRAWGKQRETRERRRAWTRACAAPPWAGQSCRR